MRKLFGIFFGAFLLFASAAQAQNCNDPSGFIKSFGVIPVGNLLILGPDCQHVQDGGSGGGSIPGFTFTIGIASTNNFAIGDATTAPVMNGASDNFILGHGAGQSLTSGCQNILIGTQNGQSLTNDCGNVLIGYLVAPLLHNGIIPLNFNTAIGNQSLRSCTQCGSNVAVGRGTMLAATIDDHNTAVGHAAMFPGLNNSQDTALGDGAGGAAVTGTPIPSGQTPPIPNVGTNVFGFNGDKTITCTGEGCGKATAAGLFNSWCYGDYCRMPARNNVGWLGNGMAAVGMSGRFWDGSFLTTVTGNAGVTINCSSILAGFIDRTGTINAAFNDQMPTAAAIVSCVSGGPGNSGEVPIALKFTYENDGTGGTSTLTGNTGTTVNGQTVVTPNNTISHWMVRITNSIAGSEAVTITRDDTVPAGAINFGAALGADVAMNVTANYFDGPAIGQGTGGTWWVAGTVTVTDTTAGANFFCKLWDGVSTVIASADVTTNGASFNGVIALSGVFPNPAGSIRISCRDPATVNGKMLFNGSGNSRDSSLYGFRIN